jgi:hypothetical protein
VFTNVWLDGNGTTLAGTTTSTTPNQPEHFVLARVDQNGRLDPSFPFTESIGQVWDSSYTVYDETATLPTPDGEHVIGIGRTHMTQHLAFFRWD